MGFDDSCWMLYDENLQNFFNFLENNVTKENILTDEEIQISADWKSRNTPMLSEEECNEKLKEYSKKFEGVANENIDREIEDVEHEISDLEQIKKSYDEVNQEMEKNLEFTKTKISALESKIIELETAEKQAHEKCMSLARQVQDVQKENKKLSNKAEDLFSRMVSFFYQLLNFEIRNPVTQNRTES